MINPRVALCISGVPKTVVESYKYYKEYLIDRYNPDIFIHIWGESSERGHWEQDNSHLYKTKQVEEINRLYKPKLLQIDEKHNEKPYYGELVEHFLGKGHGSFLRCVYNAHSMYESIYKANELKKQYEIENNFTYDFVIRGRFDIVLSSISFFEELDMNHIYVTYEKMPIELNDQFAVSSSKNMDIYSACYLQTKEAIDILIKNGTKIYTENILSTYLMMKGVSVKEVSIRLTPKIEESLKTI